MLTQLASAMWRCWLTGFREQPSMGTRHWPPAFVLSDVSCTGCYQGTAWAQLPNSPAQLLRGETRSREGGRHHLSWDKCGSQARRDAVGSSSCGRSKVQLRGATRAKNRAQPAGARAARAESCAESRAAQRAHSPCPLHVWCVPCFTCLHGSQRRQTRSKSAVPSRAALAHFSLKLWLPGCRTSLALAVPRQARQNPRLCSAGPHQSRILASIFCHPFPKAQHRVRTTQTVSGCHFAAVLQFPSRRAITLGLLWQAWTLFLRSFGGL